MKNESKWKVTVVQHREENKPSVMARIFSLGLAVGEPCAWEAKVETGGNREWWKNYYGWGYTRDEAVRKALDSARKSRETAERIKSTKEEFYV